MLFASPPETTSDNRFATHPTSNQLVAFGYDPNPVHPLGQSHQYEIMRTVREVQSIIQKANLPGITEVLTGALSAGIDPMTYAELWQGITAISSDVARETSPSTTVRHDRSTRTEKLREDAKLAQHRYGARIEELREDAQLEEILWNKDSETDFWAFAVTNSHWRKGLLGLVNNGNLRATWKKDDGAHLALQFLGDSSAEFVIFKRRPGSRRISRVAGVDTVQGVLQQISAFDLARLVHS